MRYLYENYILIFTFNVICIKLYQELTNISNLNKRMIQYFK